jgi:hypothetical protein
MGIQRIVCFRFKPGASAASRERHFAQFAALRSHIPQILEYRCGATIPLGAEAPGQPPRYDAFHYMTFAGTKEVDQYYLHPAHTRFVQDNRESWAEAIVINAEMLPTP